MSRNTQGDFRHSGVEVYNGPSIAQLRASLARLPVNKIPLPDLTVRPEPVAYNPPTPVRPVTPIPVTSERDTGRKSNLTLSDGVRPEHAIKHSTPLRESASTCKARPEPTVRKRGGSGGAKTFIPWCDRKKR